MSGESSYRNDGSHIIGSILKYRVANPKISRVSSDANATASLSIFIELGSIKIANLSIYVKPTPISEKGIKKPNEDMITNTG
jgi:hypothetical protein